jgi:thiosulfate dehydrogenase [quinone] large subunit
MVATRTGRAIAIARILTGVLFVAEGASKIAGDFVRGGFAESVRETAAGRAWPFWASFLEAVVQPNASAFGWFFALAELALGVGLVLGLLTRVAAVCGMVLMLIILLGATYVPGRSWDEWVTSGLNAKFAFLLLWLLFLTDAGRVWGIDGRLRKGSRFR